MNNLRKAVFADKTSIELVHRGLWMRIDVDKDKAIMTFSTLIFSDPQYIPEKVRSCVNKSQESKKPHYPSFLQSDHASNSVWFIQEVPMNCMSPLLQLEKSFCGVAKFWGRLLKKLANEDLLYCE